MSKQTQKEAVFQAITNVLTEANIPVEGDVSTSMTRELRAQVNSILIEGFTNGTIEIKGEFDTKELKAYVSGLQSNWLRKDKRLNGNVSYVAQKPGSRAGSGDAQLKNMRILLATLTPGTEDFAEVESAIATRVSEVHVAKKPVKTIDFSLLPADLAAKFQK